MFIKQLFSKRLVTEIFIACLSRLLHHWYWQQDMANKFDILGRNNFRSDSLAAATHINKYTYITELHSVWCTILQMMMTLYSHRRDSVALKWIINFNQSELAIDTAFQFLDLICSVFFVLLLIFFTLFAFSHFIIESEYCNRCERFIDLLLCYSKFSILGFA